MADINEHTIQGRLCDAPKVLRNERGAIARLRVATNYRSKDRNGEWQNKPTFHTVIVRGDHVDLVEELGKGDAIGASGFVEEREFTDSRGDRRAERQIVAKRLWLPLVVVRRETSDRESPDCEAPVRNARPPRRDDPPRREAPHQASRSHEEHRSPVRATSAARALPPAPSDDDVFGDLDQMIRGGIDHE